MGFPQPMPLAQDDSRWLELHSGYRRPYDPRPVVEALRSPATREAARDELWQELLHQGDVGSASHAAVALLVQVREGNPDWGGSSTRCARPSRPK